MRKRMLAAACALWLVVPTFARAQALPAATAKTPELAMADQLGTAHDLKELRGDVAVLIFSDREGAEASRALGAKLHVAFHPSAAGLAPAAAAKAPVRPLPDWPAGVRQPDARMIALACIGEVPTLLHGYVRSRFRSACPDGSIWLDFTDQLRRDFSVKAGLPNVVVLDPAGRLRYQVTGVLDEQQYGQLCRIIDELRLEVRPR